MLTDAVSFNPCNCDHGWPMLLPLCRWGSQGPERLSDSSKVTQLLSREARIQIHVCLILTYMLFLGVLSWFFVIGMFLGHALFLSASLFLSANQYSYAYVPTMSKGLGISKKNGPYSLLSRSIGSISKTTDSAFFSIVQNGSESLATELLQNRQALLFQLHGGDSWNMIFQRTELYHHYCI